MKSCGLKSKLERLFEPKSPGAAVPGLAFGLIVWQLVQVRTAPLKSGADGIPQLTVSKSLRPAAWSAVSRLLSGRLGFGG